MPYIADVLRPEIRQAISVAADKCDNRSGNLNYAVTVLIHEWLARHPNRLCYGNINTVIGILECAKLELYRMIAAPYEDRKREANGDIGILEEKTRL